MVQHCDSRPRTRRSLPTAIGAHASTSRIRSRGVSSTASRCVSFGDPQGRDIRRRQRAGAQMVRIGPVRWAHVCTRSVHIAAIPTPTLQPPQASSPTPRPVPPSLTQSSSCPPPELSQTHPDTDSDLRATKLSLPIVKSSYLLPLFLGQFCLNLRTAKSFHKLLDDMST